MFNLHIPQLNPKKIVRQPLSSEFRVSVPCRPFGSGIQRKSHDSREDSSCKTWKAGMCFTGMLLYELLETIQKSKYKVHQNLMIISMKSHLPSYNHDAWVFSPPLRNPSRCLSGILWPS